MGSRYLVHLYELQNYSVKRPQGIPAKIFMQSSTTLTRTRLNTCRVLSAVARKTITSAFTTKTAINSSITIRSRREWRCKKYYIASFPFFNRINALVYDLILCTGNIEGFKLLKKTAWQVFGGSSSNKNTHGQDRQGTFDFFPKDFADEYCYHVEDIAHYLQSKFAGRKDVPLREVRDTLDNHPVFPSDSFMNEIKSVLRQKYGAVISQNTITFSSRRYSHEEG